MLQRPTKDELRRLGSDVLSFFLWPLLRPLSLDIRPYAGLVLTGTVDEVRTGARRNRSLPINGVEIIGYGKPVDPSCEFLKELIRIRFARLFPAQLTHLESLESLKQLRHLEVDQVAAKQAIPIDLSLIPELERAGLDWFAGADTIFAARGKLMEVEALQRLSSLRWLALHAQGKLTDFTGLSGHPTLGFLWIEGCPKLGSIEWLADMAQLETLRILDCGEIRGIEALRSLPRLKHVHIHGRVNVITSDFSFLRGLPNLESAFIRGMSPLEADYWAKRNVRYDLLRRDLTG